MVIGFTGTQVGMTESQVGAFALLLETEFPDILEFAHGDCIGADADAHGIVRRVYPDVRIKAYPPVVTSKRAYCDADSWHLALPYLERNRWIVRDSDLLIACPKGFQQELRSGTWATIRYARKTSVPVIIIWPNGSIE